MKKLIRRIQNNCKRTFTELKYNEDTAMTIETIVLMQVYISGGANVFDALYLALAVAIVIRIGKTEHIRDKKNTYLSKMYSES